jgi:flagellin
MGFSIVTNTASLNAQRNLSRTQTELGGNLARLSSGLRINNASDDAAGLAISEKLRAQIRGLGQAERNTMDGVSLIQTAEGAMNEVSGILTRMRELAVQSANGTLGSTERNFLNEEFEALTSEVDRIANVTEFNGLNLLDGTTSQIDFQVGINDTANDQITASMTEMHTSAGALNVATLSVSTATDAGTALAALDTAIDAVSSGRSTLGASQNRLQITISNLGSARENLAAANSRIRDVDVAAETSAMTRNNILMQAGVSVLAQANQIPSLALSLLG